MAYIRKRIHETEIEEEYVWVRRQWNDYRKAKYKLSDIEGIHWDWISGGVQVPSPQPFIHGYVSCDGAIEGEVAHSGCHGPCPHYIKVCITKKDNKNIFPKLLEKAGPKPPPKPKGYWKGKKGIF